MYDTDCFFIQSILNYDSDMYYVSTTVFFYNKKVHCSFIAGDFYGIRPLGVTIVDGRALCCRYYGIESNDDISVCYYKVYDDWRYYSDVFNCLMKEIRNKYV